MIYQRKSRKGTAACTKPKIFRSNSNFKGPFFYFKICIQHFYKSRKNSAMNSYAPITQFQQPSTFCHKCLQDLTLKVESPRARVQIFMGKYSFFRKHAHVHELMHGRTHPYKQ